MNVNGLRRSGMAAVAALALAVGLAACGGDDEAEPAGGGGSEEASQAVEPLTVALATTQSDILNYIADKNGYFDEENVEVEIQDNTQATTTSLVVSGKADLGAFSSVGPITAAQQGRDSAIVYIISGGGVGGYMIGDSERVQTVEDLADVEDCVIGTFPQGTSSYGYGNLYKEKFAPNCEITPLQDAQSQVGAFASGRATAVVGGFSFLTGPAQEQDASVLVDTTEAAGREKAIGAEFPEVVFWGVKDALEEKRESVQRWLRALDKARDFVEQTPSEELATVLSELPAFSSIPKPGLVPIAEGFKTYQPLGNTNGHVDEEQWGAAREGYASFGIPNYDPDAPEVSYEERVDMSYYTEALGPPSE